MATILQTIVWKQYFIHIAHKFGNRFGNVLCQMETTKNYTNPGHGLPLVDTLWNAGSYPQPLEQEGNPMT